MPLIDRILAFYCHICDAFLHYKLRAMSLSLDDVLKKSLLPKSDYKAGKSKAEVAAHTKSKKLYKLSSNENLLGSSSLALQAIRDSIPRLNEYCDRSDKKLREALADYYKEIGLTASQFITDNSAVSLINLIETCFLREGDEIIITNPSFKPYAVFARKLGATVIDVPLVGDEFVPDVNAIKEAITERTRLIFLTSPNNPTGTYIPKKYMDQIVDLLPDFVVLVYDEVYFQFVDVDDYVRAYDYLDSGKHIIGVNSFSKAYGLAGLRSGYAYSSEKIARYVSQGRTPFMINTLTMEASMAALKDDQFIQETVSIIHKEKAFLYGELDKLGIKYWKSQANFITIRPEMNDLTFEAAMLEEGLMVRPVANFGALDCIRVTIGDREANEAYLSALKKVLNLN